MRDMDHEKRKIRRLVVLGQSMRVLLAIGLLVLVLVCGCKKEAAPIEAYERAGEVATPSAPAQPETKLASLTTSQIPAVPTEPLLITTATMEMRAKDYRAAEAKIRAITKQAGGFVSDSRFTIGDDGLASGQITVRVPQGKLAEVMEAVEKLGTVISRHTESEDVTEEFVDLEARRRNLEREEQRLIELLQKAGKVSELLEVETKLASVRGEIEQATGRLRYLTNRVQLATLNISLEEWVGTPAAALTEWAPLDVAKRALRALFVALRTIATVLIWLGVFIPIWVPILIIGWAVRRRRAKLAIPPASSP